jgi:hypothetical protein
VESRSVSGSGGGQRRSDERRNQTDDQQHPAGGLGDGHKERHEAGRGDVERGDELLGRAISWSTASGSRLTSASFALAAEQQTERFARAGGRGVVLRFGLLDGPGTGSYPPLSDLGATLHVRDAGRALLSALSLPSGIYNVCRDGERVSIERFTRAAGWHPQQ